MQAVHRIKIVRLDRTPDRVEGETGPAQTDTDRSWSHTGIRSSNQPSTIRSKWNRIATPPPATSRPSPALPRASTRRASRDVRSPPPSSRRRGPAARWRRRPRTQASQWSLGRYPHRSRRGRWRRPEWDRRTATTPLRAARPPRTGRQSRHLIVPNHAHPAAREPHAPPPPMSGMQPPRARLPHRYSPNNADRRAILAILPVLKLGTSSRVGTGG